FYFDTALIIAVVLTVGLFIYFKYTKHGYEISVAGDSLNTAKYAGMKTNRIIIRTMFLSAAIIGLAGSLTLTGASASHTMSAGISSGVGWTAIIVAWLAKLNPASIVLSAVLMSMLEQGSGVARSAMGISLSAAQIIQGVILFSVLAFDFLLRYKVTFRFMRNKNPDGAAPAVGEGKQ
ncbi:MAG: hypothetical protein LBS99_00715, partial [Clostridiales bacterium]|nr:hypothetical protein [Clostridiales bacterium]